MFPGMLIRQETLIGCPVRKIHIQYCACAWDSTLPVGQFILDRNPKTRSDTSHGLHGEELGHVVSSPGTKSIALGWGKLLPLSYFITLTVALDSSSDVWSRESLVWVKHAIGKAESNSANEQLKTTQLPCHNTSWVVTSFKLRIISCPPNTVPWTVITIQLNVCEINQLNF